MTTSDCDPAAAALHYIILAMMQRTRPDIDVANELLCGLPPDLTSGDPFPYQWTWEPADNWADNLRKARLLLDTELAEPAAFEETGCYPSQEDISEWTFRNFGHVLSPAINALGLCEEVGELCRALIKREQLVRGDYEEWTGEIRKELGDIFIKLVDTADRLGFDLMTVAVLRWQTIRQRDFRADPIAHGLPKEDAA